LSRALRYLDLKSQNTEIEDAAHHLVSDESPDGKGAFSLSRGMNTLGALQLEKNGNNVSAHIVDTIFHVFSEDFVHHELRERAYKISGEIENQIAVDSESIKLKDAKDAWEKAVNIEQAAAAKVEGEYEFEKLAELHTKAGINKQLKEYKDLKFGGLLDQFTEKPTPLSESFTDILKDLDSLKSIPAEPVHPASINTIINDDIDMAALAKSLEKITSPSSVSEEIKKKIEKHHAFYQEGTKIVIDGHSSTCPFCEQGITSPDPSAIIDSYIAYFEDEEEKHKTELREFFRTLNRKEEELRAVEINLAKQISHYDTLKQFIPSKKFTEIDGASNDLNKARAAINSTKENIISKAQALSFQHKPSGDSLITYIANINNIIITNNTKCQTLSKAVEKSDEERKALQRKLCKAFDYKFAITNWEKIENLRTIKIDADSKKRELTALEKSQLPTSARARVAETFELLLKAFFTEKYVFDKDTFILKRGKNDMMRGPQRTLSDGEKTAIAFCYFIASIHRKVRSEGDYKKLFLVFDDPVNSMSYDFVFTIAQILKHLSISNKGEISINPSKIDGNKCARPELLILTHSSYFFNISRTNNVVRTNATFSLSADTTTHKLTHLASYVAPFEQQLAHVYRVANDGASDHSTGNAIRSVLEAVGRFCRPDKTEKLENFIIYLAGEEGFSIKSVMINSLSHGTYYDEAPLPDDLKLACQEVVAIVERFAEGQIKIIRDAAGLKAG